MSFGRIYDIAGSGMAAQRLRVQLIAANVANAETTRTLEGGPFRKKEAVFKVDDLGRTPEGQTLAGVKVADVIASQDPFLTKHEPGHPDAGPDGMVRYPNVNPVEEMVNLTAATQSFSANVAVIRAARTMSMSAQDLLRVQ